MELLDVGGTVYGMAGSFLIFFREWSEIFLQWSFFM